MLLESTFLAEVANTTEALLLTRAQSLDAAGLAEALQEDAAVAARRDALEQRQQKLSAALATITQLAPEVVAAGRAQAEHAAAMSGYKLQADGTTSSSSASASAALHQQAAAGAAGVQSSAEAVAAAVPLSEPEKRALAAKDGSLAHLVYKSDGDNGGLVYWVSDVQLLWHVLVSVDCVVYSSSVVHWILVP
jgi:hypothetical protein